MPGTVNALIHADNAENINRENIKWEITFETNMTELLDFSQIADDNFYFKSLLNAVDIGLRSICVT